jgi:hypothetical protein
MSTSIPSTGGIVPRDLCLNNLTVSNVLCVNKISANQLTLSGTNSSNIFVQVTALPSVPSNPSIILNSSFYKPLEKITCLQFIIQTTIQLPTQKVNLAQIDPAFAPVVPASGTTVTSTVNAGGGYRVNTDGVISFILSDSAITEQFPVNITYSTV